MGKRTTSRRLAMQALYQMDITKKTVMEALASVISEDKLSPEAISYAEILLQGTFDNVQKIDDKLKQLSQQWPLDRMSIVDKNILRLASYEIMFQKETPYAVVADEAVELAKKYSGTDSSKFVNGILGALIKDLGQ